MLHAPIGIDCPVVLLQSKQDSVVSWKKALQIETQLTSNNVDVVLLEDGDHSLSRPQDLVLLAEKIQGMIRE